MDSNFKFNEDLEQLSLEKNSIDTEFKHIPPNFENSDSTSEISTEIGNKIEEENNTIVENLNQILDIPISSELIYVENEETEKNKETSIPIQTIVEI